MKSKPARQRPSSRHLVVRHIPHHHGVGAVAEFVVAHHHAEAPHHAGLLEAPQARDDLAFAESDAVADLGEWTLYQRQALGDGGQQAPVSSSDGRHPGAHAAVGHSFPSQFEPQVDVVVLDQAGTTTPRNRCGAAISSSTCCRRALSGAATTNQRLSRCSRS